MGDRAGPGPERAREEARFKGPNFTQACRGGEAAGTPGASKGRTMAGALATTATTAMMTRSATASATAMATVTATVAATATVASRGEHQPGRQHPMACAIAQHSLLCAPCGVHVWRSSPAAARRTRT